MYFEVAFSSIMNLKKLSFHGAMSNKCAQLLNLLLCFNSLHSEAPSVSGTIFQY